MERYFTRAQLVEELQQRGYPLSKSKFEKLAAPSAGRGPPCAGVFGNREIYTLAAALPWAESLIRRKPQYKA